MHEFVCPVFAWTDPGLSFSVIGGKRFGLVFARAGFINSGTVQFKSQLLSFRYCSAFMVVLNLQF